MFMGVLRIVCQPLSWLKPSCPGGPGQGKPCVFPFRFGGTLRSSCITDLDPEVWKPRDFLLSNLFCTQGKFWCSTRVDEGGNHVTGTGEWGHCSAGCPRERKLSNPGSSSSSSSSSSSTSSSSSSLSSSGQTSSAFTVEGTSCKTRTGVSGTCRWRNWTKRTLKNWKEKNCLSL